MQDIRFWKVEAAGNDFVMIDYRKPFYKGRLADLAVLLTNRRLGIGADGVIFIKNVTGADFYMAYYNADGSGPVMCGNGGRAALFFVAESNINRKSHYHFLTSDGPHDGQFRNGQAALTIKYPSKFEKVVLDFEAAYLVNTGVPHMVRFVEAVDKVEIFADSPELRRIYDANINYIEKVKNDFWKIRTYERGVEDETLACGTGAAASATTIHRLFQQDFPISLQARGGTLKIDSDNDSLWLSGPVRKVFEGTFHWTRNGVR